MAVASPCTKVCRIEPAHGLCVGCGRTLDEIARWLSLSDPERQAIVDALPARLSSMSRRSVPPR
jgi:predicted Fe-S protein YdhL (DUF1289 family)